MIQLKTITVHMTDKAYALIRTTGFVSFMAQTSEAHAPIAAMNKVIRAIDEGKTEVFLKLRDDEEQEPTK